MASIRFAGGRSSYDLRTAPDSFVKHWEYLRDALQKLEHDFGPSDNWK
jgi:hypothetical protein